MPTAVKQAVLLEDVLRLAREMCVTLPKDSPGYAVGRLLTQAYLAAADDLREGTSTATALADKLAGLRGWKRRKVAHA